MLKKKISELAFRIKVRKALTDNSNEMLIITWEETRKEMIRRKLLSK